MIQPVRRGIAHVINFVLPRLCCGCGERILEHGMVVCGDCLGQIPPLVEPVCVTCGCPDARMMAPGKCRDCLPGKIWFGRAEAVATFTGLAQLLVYRLKYQSRLEYAEVIASMMVGKLGAEWGGTGSIEPLIVVPVPLHRVRKRQRGFNQATLLGKYIAAARNMDFAETLARIRATETQTRLRKRMRRKNVEGAFVCKRPETIAGKQVLLVDDVYTTGNTLNECARVLMEAGAARVECIAFARAAMD